MGKDLMGKITDFSLGATVFFILVATIVLTQFNTAYNFVVTGLSSSTLQGLLLLILVLLMVGIGRNFIKK